MTGQFTGAVQGSRFLLGRRRQQAAVHGLQPRQQGEADRLVLTSGAVTDGATGGVDLGYLHLP